MNELKNICLYVLQQLDDEGCIIIIDSDDNLYDAIDDALSQRLVASRTINSLDEVVSAITR